MNMLDHLPLGAFLGQPGLMWFAFIGLFAAGVLVRVPTTGRLEAAR